MDDLGRRPNENGCSLGVTKNQANWGVRPVKRNGLIRAKAKDIQYKSAK